MPAILSKAGAMRAGLLAAVAATAAAWDGPECPRDLTPYSSEANAFGWPITPSEFEFSLPQCWAEKYPLCAGKHQSPLNIDLRLDDADCASPVVPGDVPGSLSSAGRYKVLPGNPAVTVSKYMRAVNVKGDIGSLTLKDADGHAVEYEATDAYLTADSLHAFNGTLSDAELLIVHKPKSAPDALGGSVILSVRFQEGPRASKFFEQMGFPATSDVSKEGSMWPAPESIDVTAALSGALKGAFYSYSGSVPVPPCTENVQYLVMERVLSVSPKQVHALKETIASTAGGYRKRPPVDRMESGEFCRKAVPNSLVVPPARSGCVKGSEQSAACWEKKCNKSPVAIVGKEASTYSPSEGTSPDFVYRPAGHVAVKPTDYELEASGDFGGVVIDGRFFEANKLSIKAVSQHTVDGARYPAELVVHHSLYGESFGAAAQHRRLETEGHAHEDAHHSGGAAGEHEVMVSIPLKLGMESPLLRDLGLGDEVRRNAIRDGNGYTVHGPVDVGAAVAAATKSGALRDWYYYSGGPTTPGECPAWGVRWIVMREPLEVSLEQLNSLALKVSGMDSTATLQHVAAGACSAGRVPKGSIEHEEGGWKSSSELCATGAAQSPIHVRTDTVSSVGQANFLAKASWKPVRGLRLENVHNTLAFHARQMGYFTLTGESGFPKYYQVTSVNLKMPSEHMVDGRQYPAELQVVHKNQKSVLEFEETDGLVASFLFDFGEENKLLAQMLPEELPAPGGHVPIAKPVDLMWALGPAMDGKFFKYDGSFTTGSCNEGARVVVFNKTMSLSMEQFKAFKAMFPSLAANRPLQPLNKRKLSENLLEEGEPVELGFFLNRQGGRNKSETPIGYIAFPIIGTLLLCTVMMTALFQREDKFRKGESAGGLTHTTGASTIGKGYSKI